jgi:hypothetical protein
MSKNDKKLARSISRRAFLKSGITLAGSFPVVTSFVGCWEPHNSTPTAPRYILTREVDEIFLELAAIGYEEREHWGVRYLEPVKEFSSPHLIFKFPPQHFAETAIAIKDLPTSVPEAELSKIALFPSRPSKLVFRDPLRRRLRLTLNDLLDWKGFELSLPDLDWISTQDSYNLDVHNPEEGPLDTISQIVTEQAFTQIEMPWGICLTPCGFHKCHLDAAIGSQLISSFLFFLSFENPSDHLISVEDHSAARPGAKARQAGLYMLLPDGPGRAADEARGVINA